MAAAKDYVISVHSDLSKLDAETECHMICQMKNLSLASFSAGSKHHERYVGNWEHIFSQEKDKPHKLHSIVTAHTPAGEMICFATTRKYIIRKLPVLYCGFLVTDRRYRNTAVTKDTIYTILDREQIQNLAGGYCIAKTANPTAVELTKLYLLSITARFDVELVMIPSFGPNGSVDPIDDHARALVRAIMEHEGGLDRFDEHTFRVSGIGDSASIYERMDIRYRDSNIGNYFKMNIDVYRGDAQIIMFHLKRRDTVEC